MLSPSVELGNWMLMRASVMQKTVPAARPLEPTLANPDKRRDLDIQYFGRGGCWPRYLVESTRQEAWLWRKLKILKIHR